MCIRDSPYIERQGGVSNISANGLVTRMVQVQLDQEKIDAINEKLLEVIDVQLADAKAQLDSAEAQIEAGRKQYETQLANYDKLVSDTINSQYSGELQDSFMLVKKQAQALLESVNQLIAVVNEPEIQQALIDVRDVYKRQAASLANAAHYVGEGRRHAAALRKEEKGETE